MPHCFMMSWRSRVDSLAQADFAVYLRANMFGPSDHVCNSLVEFGDRYEEI